MTEFADIYDLLETVRAYELRPKEHLIPLNSVLGTEVGFMTADSDFPSISWAMSARQAKLTALARGTKEGRRIRELLSSHAGRRQLLEELRAGTLEYGVAPYSPFARQGFQPVSSEDVECLRETPAPLKTSAPKQCTIPGL